MQKILANILSGEATGLVACLLLFALVALQYFAGRYTSEMAKVSNEQELKEHLLDLSKLAVPMLAKPAQDLVDLADDAELATTATSAYQVYREGMEPSMTEAFKEFATRARLMKVVLIKDDGQVLYDSMNPDQTLRHYDFWNIDRGEISTALQGLAEATAFYQAPDGMMIKRLYAPIRDSASQDDEHAKVRVMLCLVAGQSYLARIGLLGDQIFNLNLTVTLFMVLVGMLIYSLIRQQRRYERQVAEADRLAGLGQLAAGFAHELRNPLEIIRAFTEDLEHSLRSGLPAAESMDACQEIIEEVERMNELVGQFLSYSRGHGDSDISGVTPVLETTQSILTILRPSVEKSHIKLMLEHPGSTAETARRWAVALDSGGYRQVLLNLTLNAIQASPKGGTVTISILSGARQVELRVQDQGPGITDKDRRRIFEPFFSTRPSGSGLGLAISRQITDRIGGSIRLRRSKPGQGACFVVILPRVRSGDTAAAEATVS